MTRKIISLAGPLAQYAVCDDGTVWTWNFTGLTGTWQPWGRPDVPQPEVEPPVLPAPTFPVPAAKGAGTSDTASGATKKGGQK